MQNFLCKDLIERFGYGMAVYIAAKAAAMQRSIDAINDERRAVGRRLLEHRRGRLRVAQERQAAGLKRLNCPARERIRAVRRD
ncbi:hypothetical protein PPGU19_066530 (plasmid) [Paraburkholderia sp. PGU19]|nr:hypothetical protein PPGU19_066530 [Paraburkholderia sp. PGU19]